MLKKWLCQADVRLMIEPRDPILIRSGSVPLEGPDMAPVSTFRNGELTYYFPGSSLKGVLRSHLERIGRTLVDGAVCVPYFDPRNRGQHPIPVQGESNAFGCGYVFEKGTAKAEVYRLSCPICRMFGSLQFGGRFSIGDAYPSQEHSPLIEERNGVAIDRFTGGTVPGALYDVQVLVGGRFEAQIRIVNFELWQLAALHLLLEDLGDEMLSIGGGRSRGMGRISGKVDQYRLSYLQPQDRVHGIGELATEEERRAYGLNTWVAEQVDMPQGLRRGVRVVYNLDDRWSSMTESLAPAFVSFLRWRQEDIAPALSRLRARAAT